MDSVMLLVLILLPALAALLLPLARRFREPFVLAALLLEAGGAVWLLLQKSARLHLFNMTAALPVGLKMDGVSKLFLLIAVVGYLLAGVYAFRYLKEGHERFFRFFLLSQAALVGMCFAENLVTMYLFFEMTTLLSMPLVLHDRTDEAIRAALKYLFYSVAGAFLGLCFIFFYARYSLTLSFVPGGALDRAAVRGHETLMQIVAFLGIVGFGAKAGLYPLHGWLPTAHPAAPAPASAILSGIIAKAGVLAIVRVLYYAIGADFLRGTWVQTALLVLALLTVLMGSMMAYREKLLKKRLAYSSVSQISYILVGLFVMTAESVSGALMHVLFHACIKICLFLCAGSFIAVAGKHCVDELRGIGRAMPKTLWGFTLASLALIGIPPASGFVSKWYLAMGALDSGLAVFSWLVPVVLLISALLTAGYLLPITIAGFFPGKDAALPPRNDEGGWHMWLPILLLAAAAVLMGCFGVPVARGFAALAQTVIGA